MKKSPSTLTGYLNRLLHGCSLYFLPLEAKKPAALMVTSHLGSGHFYYFFPSTLVIANRAIARTLRLYRIVPPFLGTLKAIEITIMGYEMASRCSPSCSLLLPHICIQEPGRNDYPQIALASLYSKFMFLLFL